MAVHQPELDSGLIIPLEVALRWVGKRNPPSWQHLDQDILLSNLSGRWPKEMDLYLENIRELYGIILEDS